MLDRITFDPAILGGRVYIRGMRIPVSVVVRQIAYGATFEEILEGHPDLSREDIQQDDRVRRPAHGRKGPIS